MLLLINLINLFDFLIFLLHNVFNLASFIKRLRMYYLFKFCQLLTFIFSSWSVQVRCDWFYVLPWPIKILNQCTFVFIWTWAIFNQTCVLFFCWGYLFFSLVLFVLWIDVFIIEGHWHFRENFQSFIQICVIWFGTF